MNKSSLTQELRVAAFTLMALVCGCQANQTPHENISGTIIWEQQSVRTEASSKEPIQFGIGPWYTQEETESYTRPLLRYLEEQTGYPFVLNLSHNYDELVADFRNKSIHIADLSASLYVQLLEEAPNTSNYIATVSAKVGGKMTGHYRGLIFTHRNQPIHSLDQLKGKTFAFVDQGSSSGFKYPLARLLDSKIEPDRDFSEIFYVGNHEAVVNTIATRQVVAGAVWDQALINGEATHGKIFKILARTSPIPREAWIAQKSISPELVSSIQAALISLTPDTKLASGERVFAKDTNFSGYVIESESFYQVVGKTTKIVNNYLTKYPSQ
jgi:phosphonate transport system substrate-binding protein